MICFYTEGSATLGLGHLSRVVPLYHEFLNQGHQVKVFFYGDELGEAFLFKHQVPFHKTVENDIHFLYPPINETPFWIVDATRFHTESIFFHIKNCRKKILISPKFDMEQISVFDFSIIRSDPFKININKKIISKKLFQNDRGKYFKKSNGISIGVALSGSNTSDKINLLIKDIINTKGISEKIDKIKVFIGGSSQITINRKTKESYYIAIEFISTLDSLWNYSEDIDFFIIGNGIIVDECLERNKPFVVLLNSINEKLKIEESNIFSFLNNKDVIDFLIKYQNENLNYQKSSDTEFNNGESFFSIAMDFFNSN